MKTPCEAAQRQLLALTDPDQPPAGVQGHLDACPTCREWRKQVVQLDRAATLLPYPPSATKAAFLQKLKSTPSRRDRLRLKAWQLTAAWSAAAVLLFVLLYNFSQSPPVTPQPAPVVALGADRWLDGLLGKHQVLAQADSTRQQIEGLARLADDVQERTQVMVQFVEYRDLRELAKLYGQAIKTSVQRAGELPRGERRQVLEPIAEQLVKARDNAQRQAREGKVGSADHPLITIASAAQLGKDGLDALMNDDALMRRGVSSGPCLAMLPNQWLAGVVRARADSGPPRAMTSAEDLAQFKRNRVLVEAIFASGIRLAGSTDQVSRAGQCNPLVAALVQEIEASRRDDARVTELATHLRGLLRDGVAHNLAKGGVYALPGSVREQQLLGVGGETIQLLDRVEAMVKTTHPKAWEAIRAGRGEVEIAIQGRGAAK